MQQESSSQKLPDVELGTALRSDSWKTHDLYIA